MRSGRQLRRWGNSFHGGLRLPALSSPSFRRLNRFSTLGTIRRNICQNASRKPRARRDAPSNKSKAPVSTPVSARQRQGSANITWHPHLKFFHLIDEPLTF